MDDVTVYQCPECNFNADNLNELDSHMVEHHSTVDVHHSNTSGKSTRGAINGAGGSTSSSHTAQASMIVSALVENEIPTRAADRMSDKPSNGGKKSDQVVSMNGGTRHHHADEEEDLNDDQQQQEDIREDENDDDLAAGNGDHDEQEEDDEDFFNERPNAKFNQNVRTTPRFFLIE